MELFERSGSTQVIIAALNEEQGIGLTISELQENLNASRMLVVDGKRAQTEKRVKQILHETWIVVYSKLLYSCKEKKVTYKPAKIQSLSGHKGNIISFSYSGSSDSVV